VICSSHGVFSSNDVCCYGTLSSSPLIYSLTSKHKLSTGVTERFFSRPHKLFHNSQASYGNVLEWRYAKFYESNRFFVNMYFSIIDKMTWRVG